MRQDAIYKLAKANLTRHANSPELTKKASADKIYNLAKATLEKTAAKVKLPPGKMSLGDTLLSIVTHRWGPTVPREPFKRVAQEAMREERARLTDRVLAERTRATRNTMLGAGAGIGLGVGGVLLATNLSKKNKQVELPQY